MIKGRSYFLFKWVKGREMKDLFADYEELNPAD